MMFHHKLHNEELDGVLSLEAVKTRDVVVVQGARTLSSRSNRASRAASCDTSAKRRLIATSRPELRVFRPVHLTHASRTEGGDDLVVGQLGAWI